MTSPDESHKLVPITAAAGLLTAGAASHHALLGAACALAVFIGLWLRQRPGKRLPGNALFLLGALAFGTGLLFGTGYTLGRDMAVRDAAHAGQH